LHHLQQRTGSPETLEVWHSTGCCEEFQQFFHKMVRPEESAKIFCSDPRESGTFVWADRIRPFLTCADSDGCGQYRRFLAGAAQ
jgi:hypothetical protein